MTDRKQDNPTPEDDSLEQQAEQELSLEEHLQSILDQIEDAEPGLMEADQLIGDDGKPRFVLKPKPKPKPQAKPTPTPAKPVAASSPIEEDELAALINQAIDQASQSGDDAAGAPKVQDVPPTSDAELSRAVDRDIDHAVEQAAKKPVAMPPKAKFNPASNFVPIEPDQLADAIEEAFANPTPPVNPSYVPDEAVMEVEPPVAPEPQPVSQSVADMADDAKLSNDDLDALFESMGQIADTKADMKPAPSSIPTATASTAPAKTDALSGIADDAKLSNDDLDALFDSMSQVADTRADMKPAPTSAPQAAVESASNTKKSLDEVDNFDRLSNEDLDALFEDPQTLLAQAQATQTPASKAADTFSESDFSSQWDMVLNQAQQELARIADEKLEKQAKRLAVLKDKAAGDPNIEKLIGDSKQSVFDDSAFAQQWDQVLGQAREQLNQVSASKQPKSTIDTSGGKLSNDDLSNQLDDLLAQVQSEAESHAEFEALNEQQLTNALDTVLDEAMSQLATLASKKLKAETQAHNEKIKTIRESLTNDELAHELDVLIDQALDAHAKSHTGEHAVADVFDETSFAAEWEDVLVSAKEELHRLADDKKKRQEKRAQQREQLQTQVQPEPAAPAPATVPNAADHFEALDPTVDLASELDDLFASAVDEQTKPAASQAVDAHKTLSNDELASELENLLSSAMEQATHSDEQTPVREVTANEIQEMIDAEQSEKPSDIDAPTKSAILNDPTADEPQDPAAMINHIDSLLAEHASQAVEDMFETPEKIAENGLTDEDLESAFQSPEEILENLQEASKATIAKQTPPQPAQPAPEKPAQKSAATPPPTAAHAPAKSAGVDPDDLEGYFEAPDELNAFAVEQPQAVEPDVEEAQEVYEAVEVGEEETDDMMGDFVSPEETSHAEQPAQHVVVEEAYESAEETQQQHQKQKAAKVANVAAAIQAHEPEDQAELEQDQPGKEKGPGLITRLIAKAKPLGKVAVNLAHQLADASKHLSPVVNKLCAMINSPLLRFAAPTRNLVGYIGLTQIFLGVILFCVFFKKMLFGD